MSHVCHAVGCNVAVPPRMFMCSPHWYKLPKVYQNVIWHYYRPGQEIDKEPSLDYIAVAFAGIACVAIQEGRTPPRFVPAPIENAQSAPEPNDGPACPLTTTDVTERVSPAPIDKERAGELQ